MAKPTTTLAVARSSKEDTSNIDAKVAKDEDPSTSMFELSEYEKERRRTMERNERKLRELGLIGHRETRNGAAVTAMKVAGRSTGTRQPTISVDVSEEDRPLRRSARTKGDTPPVYKENFVVGFDNRTGGRRKRSRTALPAPPQQATSHHQCGKPLPHDSSREHLGRRFAEFGKAPVMNLSTTSHAPKFSRMSGTTEWKNAVFLWVNVGENGGGYTNVFEGSSRAEQQGTAPPNLAAHEAERTVSVQNVKDMSPSSHVGRRLESGVASPCDPSMGQDSTLPVSGRARRADSTSDVAPRGRSDALRMTWYAGARLTPDSALIKRLLLASGGAEKAHLASKTAWGTTIEADGEAADGAMRHARCGEGGNMYSPTSELDSKRGMCEAATPQGTPASETPMQRQLGIGRAEEAERGCPPRHPCDSSGSRGHDEPLKGDPANQVAAQKVAPNNGSGNDIVVLLFCRVPNEPYVFCGRLDYETHWPDERPLRFLWSLKDAASLAESRDFRAVVEAATTA